MVFKNFPEIIINISRQWIFVCSNDVWSSSLVTNRSFVTNTVTKTEIPTIWLADRIHSICSKWNGSRTLEAPFSWRIRASGVFGFVFDETTNRIYCHRVSKHHLSLVIWKYAQSTYLDVPQPIEGYPITLHSLKCLKQRTNLEQVTLQWRNCMQHMERFTNSFELLGDMWDCIMMYRWCCSVIVLTGD